MFIPGHFSARGDPTDTHPTRGEGGEGRGPAQPAPPPGKTDRPALKNEPYTEISESLTLKQHDVTE